MWSEYFPFNADEAVVGLLARHILEGRWSTFFYGQAYLGSLDSALIAIAFAFTGPSVFGIRFVQVAIYLGTMATTMILAREILRSNWAALVAGLLLAVPSLNVTLYTTVSIGGYGETLLLGNVLLLLTLAIWKQKTSYWLWAAWGFTAGLGFWTFGLILVYVIPCGAAVLLAVRNLPAWPDRRRKLSLLLLLGFVGMSPWLIFAIAQGPSVLVEEFFGSAVAGASPDSLLSSIIQHSLNFLLFGTTAVMGIRPPWEIRWLVVPMIPLIIVFWVLALWRAARVSLKDRKNHSGYLLLMGVCAATVFGFILTPFGADPSGRYFLTLSIPMTIFGAGLLLNIRRRGLGIYALMILIGLLVYGLLASYQGAILSSAGITTQFDSVTWIDHQYDEELVAFMASQNIDRGYSNYWVSYPLAFTSGEKIQLVPGLPYHLDFRHTWRDHRYAPYLDAAEEAGKIAYISSNHPELEIVLAESLLEAGSSFREIDIGDYHVIYDVTPNRQLKNLEGLPWDVRP